MARFDLQLDFRQKSAEAEWGRFDFQLEFQQKSAEAESGRFDLQLDFQETGAEAEWGGLICNSSSNRRVQMQNGEI
jgi:hypothetical protein